MQAVREHDRLWLERGPVDLRGAVAWGGWRIESRLPGLKVRGWRPGDRLAGRTRKVQDVFVDAKIPRSDREGWPLVVRGDEVVAVPGIVEIGGGDGELVSTTELERGVGEILIDEEALAGADPRARRARSPPTTPAASCCSSGVLKGAVFFMADLMRSITVPCEIDFMAISSYGASTDSSGVVRILKDLDINIDGRHVLVVEDIIDSGLTLSYLLRNLESREPASLEICALLTKPERPRDRRPGQYVGFEIPNRFVIGYGLDFAERYRNLPYVGVLHPDLMPEGV